MDCNKVASGPQALFGREMDPVELLCEQTPELPRHPVVRDKQAVVVRKTDEVPIKEPVAGRGEGETILDDVRAAVLDRPDMRRLNLHPATTILDPKASDGAGLPIGAHPRTCETQRL